MTEDGGIQTILYTLIWLNMGKVKPSYGKYWQIQIGKRMINRANRVLYAVTCPYSTWDKSLTSAQNDSSGDRLYCMSRYVKVAGEMSETSVGFAHVCQCFAQKIRSNPDLPDCKHYFNIFQLSIPGCWAQIGHNFGPRHGMRISKLCERNSCSRGVEPCWTGSGGAWMIFPENTWKYNM